MIVDFTIENFRSIKSEQLLSMYAENKPKHHAGNISHIEDELGVLKTCAIYGSNAAGKTNIILAFKALKKLMIESGDLKDGDPINCYEPNVLSKHTIDKPTCFEIEFYVEGVRYLYRIEYNQREIVYEKLDFYRSSRKANLFTRESASDWKAVKFGEHYKGGKKQIAFFANNAYLAKAGNTPDSPEIIRKVFNYFRAFTETVLTDQVVGIFDWNEDPETVLIINTFLKKIDLGINKFEIENEENIDQVQLPENISNVVKNKLISELSKKEYFYHEVDDGSLIRFDRDKESRGTQRIFKLLPFIIHVLRQGSILFFDEIESSFHPHVAELIIKLFNDPLVNKKNAQLIFTTHNLTLMSSTTMRKDQVYLVQKSVEAGTELKCLDSYDSTLKDSSPFAKWYDEGRLGAIPSINYHDISECIKGAF